MTMTKSKRSGLQHVFQFNPDDLDANRSGIMTGAQKSTLKARFSDGYRLYFLIALHSVILLGALIYTWWTQQDNAFYMQRSGDWLLISVVITVAVLVLFVVLMGWHRQTIGQETQQGTVRELTGICLLNQPRDHSLTYTLQVDGESFSVSPAQARAFESGSEYRLYISPQTRQILSAERT